MTPPVSFQTLPVQQQKQTKPPNSSANAAAGRVKNLRLKENRKNDAYAHKIKKPYRVFLWYTVYMDWV
tara:strand:- start:211 stop:414 length:204 start_codon:yes stop_codon:yes gene_type:complete